MSTLLEALRIWSSNLIYCQKKQETSAPRLNSKNLSKNLFKIQRSLLRRSEEQSYGVKMN